MSNIIQNRMRAVRRQAEILQRAITSPAGIFETVDEMIKNIRLANKETVRQLTGRKMFSPQLGGEFRERFGGVDLQKIRSRLRLPF